MVRGDLLFPVSMPLSSQCALDENGNLMDASEIVFYDSESATPSLTKVSTATI